MRTAIRLTTKVRRHGDNGALLAAALKKLGKMHVDVGVVAGAGQYPQKPAPAKPRADGTRPAPAPSVEQVAAWMEFGTSDGRVPERSFMRRTYYEKLNAINELRRAQLLAVTYQGRSAEKALATLGFQVAEMIKNTIKSNVGPPLNAAYVEKKRRLGQRLTSLRASDLLLRSIGFAVQAGRGKGQ